MTKRKNDLITVLGARPQFIKAAVVSKELQKIGISECIIHTGQHFDHQMSQVFFDELGLSSPSDSLNLSGLSFSEFLVRAVSGVSDTIEKYQPRAVMVYGDTYSTLAGALAAKKLNKSLIHVEAGLRSGSLTSPEEYNRVVTDSLSDIAYCPTQSAVQQLGSEGFRGKALFSGDVMLDSAKKALNDYSPHEGQTPYVLATIHRAETVDNRKLLSAVLDALSSIKMEIHLPLHPRTKARIASFDLKLGDNIHVTNPYGYNDMIAHVADARLVVTDSGGLQKEAYFCGTPSLILRDETEWRELIELGVSALAGRATDKIIKMIEEELQRPLIEMEKLKNPFGDGKAGQFIAEDLVKFIEHPKQYADR